MTIQNDIKAARDAYSEYRDAATEHNRQAERWTDQLSTIYSAIEDSAGEIESAHSTLSEAYADVHTTALALVRRFIALSRWFTGQPHTYSIAEFISEISGGFGVGSADRLVALSEGLISKGEATRIIAALEAIEEFDMTRLSDGTELASPDDGDVPTVDVDAWIGKAFDADAADALALFAKHVETAERDRAVERANAAAAEAKAAKSALPEVVAPDPDVLPERVRLTAALVELKAIHATTPDPRTDAALRAAMMLLESTLA